jgi:flagellar biosynthetic protein FliQ
MTEALFLELIQKTLMLIIQLALPVLAVSLGVGLLISLFQALTQIQEQTLTFVPKIVGGLVTLAILGPWMLNKFVSFVNELFASIPEII